MNPNQIFPGSPLWQLLDQVYTNGTITQTQYAFGIANGWLPSQDRRPQIRQSSSSGNGMLTTTTSSDLYDIAGKMGLKNFKVFSKQDLPKKLTAGNYIINIDNGPSGTHWVSLHSSPKQGTVYFDSFGMEIDPQILAFVKSIKRNAKSIELDAQDIEATSCGYWGLFFLYQMQNGVSIPAFMNLITDDQLKNEKMLEGWFEQSGAGFFDLVKKGFQKITGVKYNNNQVSFDGEQHLPWGAYQFAGPGTKIKQRLDLLKKGKSKPINDIDKAAFTHDIQYSYARYLLANNQIDAKQLKEMIAEADSEFISNVKASKDNTSLSKALVAGTFGVKKLLDAIRENPLFAYGSRDNDPTDKQWQELGYETF